MHRDTELPHKSWWANAKVMSALMAPDPLAATTMVGEVFWLLKINVECFLLLQCSKEDMFLKYGWISKFLEKHTRFLRSIHKYIVLCDFGIIIIIVIIILLFTNLYENSVGAMSFQLNV